MRFTVNRSYDCQKRPCFQANRAVKNWCETLNKINKKLRFSTVIADTFTMKLECFHKNWVAVENKLFPCSWNAPCHPSWNWHWQSFKKGKWVKENAASNQREHQNWQSQLSLHCVKFLQNWKKIFQLEHLFYIKQTSLLKASNWTIQSNQKVDWNKSSNKGQNWMNSTNGP